jgi:hypothetical protein
MKVGVEGNRIRNAPLPAYRPGTGDSDTDTTAKFSFFSNSGFSPLCQNDLIKFLAGTGRCKR